MNLRFVEAFYWVVTLKSVTRASERLHLTQSAMSSRVAALEQELGVLLLDRRDKTFRLTQAGQRFFGYAERLLAMQREIMAELGNQAERPVVLRVGTFESALHSWLMEWVRALHDQHPALALELTVETSPVLVDQIARGALDLVIAALPAEAAGLRAQALSSMEMVFVGHAQRHRRRQWTLADIAKQELLTFQRGSQPQVAMLDLFRRAGLEPARVHSVSSISALAQLVEDGVGIATLPAAVLERLRKRRPLRMLTCEAKMAPLPTYLSWRVDPSSGAQRTMVDSLLAHLRVNPEKRKSR